jgi:AcrR family transcriptional regulator
MTSQPSLSPTVKTRRPGGRSARIRAAVLQQALGLLLDKGFAEFSIAAVAARSGVHETSIYRRWATKSGLLLDACLHFAEMNVSLPDTGAVRTDLIALLASVATLLQSAQGKAMLAMTAALDDDSVAARRDFWRRRLAAATLLIERAKARGEIGCDVDSGRLLESLIAPLHFRALVSIQPLAEWPIEEMVDRQIGAFADAAR